MLQAEEIKLNWEHFRRKVNELFPTRADKLNKMYDDSGNVSSTFEDILDKERNVAIPKSTNNADYIIRICAD